MDLSFIYYFFFRSICKEKNICLNPEIGKQSKCFAKNLEIFWMNNKTIIEFSFCMMKRLNYADTSSLMNIFPESTELTQSPSRFDV